MQTLDGTVIYRLVLLTSLSSTSFYLKKISGRMMWHVDSQFPDRGIEPVAPCTGGGAFSLTPASDVSNWGVMNCGAELKQ